MLFPDKSPTTNHSCNAVMQLPYQSLSYVHKHNINIHSSDSFQTILFLLSYYSDLVFDSHIEYYCSSVYLGID
jgi:hypothetical protein